MSLGAVRVLPSDLRAPVAQDRAFLRLVLGSHPNPAPAGQGPVHDRMASRGSSRSAAASPLRGACGGGCHGMSQVVEVIECNLGMRLQFFGTPRFPRASAVEIQ